MENKYIPELAKTTVYKLRGVTYLPHYSEPCYVGPGYGVVRDRVYSPLEMHYATRKFSVLELTLYGAVPEGMMLWTGLYKSGSFRECQKTREAR